MSPEYKLETINGQKVLFVPKKDGQAATIMAITNFGSRDENIKTNGIAHFIEHLMFKGTKKWPNHLVLSKELDALGAEFNAFTSKDHTAYYIKAASEHLPKTIEVLADMLQHSLFEDAEIERERGVIIEEIHMYEDNPLFSIEDEIEKLVFAGHTLGWKISGEPHHIRGIERQDIVNYYHNYYQAGNMLLLVSGKFSQSEARKLIAKFFKLKNGQRNTRPKFNLKQASSRLKVISKDTQQVQLALGFKGLARTDKRMPALSVLTSVLGGNMSSRLFVEVREKRGLAYSVKAFNSNFSDTGALIVQSGLEVKQVAEAYKLIKQILLDTVAKGITKSELVMAKNYLIGRLKLQLEDPATLAQWLGTQMILDGQAKTIKEKIKEIEAVKLSQVQAVAKSIFNFSASSLAVIGPYQEKDIKKFFK